MNQKLSQADADRRFRRALLAFDAELRRIDWDTPNVSSDTEPQWWLKLSALLRQTSQTLRDMHMIPPPLEDSSHQLVLSKQDLLDLQDAVGSVVAEGTDSGLPKTRVKRLEKLFEKLTPWEP